MQWLGMILSFVFGRMNFKSRSWRELAHEIFDEVVFKSRRLVTLSLVGLGAVIIFCGGFFISLLDTTTQYDRNGFVAWTATLSAGIGLIVIAAVAFSVVFFRAWPKENIQSPSFKKHKPHTSTTTGSPLEVALAALVMDFVKDREMRRTEKTAAAAASTEPLFNEENPTYRDRDDEEKETPPLH